MATAAHELMGSAGDALERGTRQITIIVRLERFEERTRHARHGALSRPPASTFEVGHGGAAAFRALGLIATLDHIEQYVECVVDRLLKLPPDDIEQQRSRVLRDGIELR